MTTLAAYRDDGFWTLVSLICWFYWKAARLPSFPPRGFVGRGSLSLAATVQQPARLKSIRLYRAHYTANAPRWRLICEWETPLPAQPPRKYGAFWGRSGRPSGVDGEGIFDPSRTTIISKSSLYGHHRFHP